MDLRYCLHCAVRKEIAGRENPEFPSVFLFLAGHEQDL
jgi:hypothetical protein